MRSSKPTRVWNFTQTRQQQGHGEGAHVGQSMSTPGISRQPLNEQLWVHFFCSSSALKVLLPLLPEHFFLCCPYWGLNRDPHASQPSLQPLPQPSNNYSFCHISKYVQGLHLSATLVIKLMCQAFRVMAWLGLRVTLTSGLWRLCGNNISHIKVVRILQLYCSLGSWGC